MSPLGGPLAIWLAALVAGGLALRARRPRRAAPRGLRVPAVLRLGAAVPIPAGLIPLAGHGSPERLLRAAGVAGALDARWVARARAGGAELARVLGLPLGLVLPPLLPVVPAAAVVAWLAPGRWLAGRARRRRRAFVRELPDLLDLLAICVESGMTLDPALRLVCERLRGELVDELRRTLAELDLGTPRRAAYASLATRCEVPEVAGVVAALLQTEELGTPLASVLGEQARALRTARGQAARDRAAGAAPRIQLVVALVMVPGAMLLVLGALVMRLAEQIGAVSLGP
jgi:tight adherence protein C